MIHKNKSLKSYGGGTTKELLVFLSILVITGYLFIGLFFLFPFSQHLSLPAKNEYWGTVEPTSLTILDPESDPSQIIRNIFDVQESIHNVINDGQYQQLQQIDIFTFGPPFKVQRLNSNYKVGGEEFAIVFHVRATPGACSATAHYLLNNERIVDVNGFEPGGKGVLARKVIESCKNGNLTVKVP